MNTIHNSSIDAQTQNVQVVVRIRPLNSTEILDNHASTLSITNNGKVLSLNKSVYDKPKLFTFDYVFSEQSTQLDIYQYSAHPIVEKTIEGYNGTIFAYGQSGTGKTYTMMGLQTDSNLKGVIPNTFSHIFSQISRADSERSFVVSVAYLEIYNENVRDLLSPNPDKKLEVRESKDSGVYIKDLSEFTVDSLENVNQILNNGNLNRVTGTTMLNINSSRSHAIFVISVESQDKINNKTTISKLNLVDLAGSERLKRTQASGDRLKETSSINQSLSVLGNVISALTDERSTYVPYRNSKLTRLLQDSLGGNTKTLMIAMVSPSEIDYEETMCTLRYASRVKYIKNNAQINVKNKQGMIEYFEQELKELHLQIDEISVELNINYMKTDKQKRKNKSIKDELKVQEEEIEKMEKEKSKILEKISTIQNKILVGGKNLVEIAEQQKFLLESSLLELNQLEESHENLEKNLLIKGEERIDIEEKYSNLQEENLGLDEKIKKVQIMLNAAKEEYQDKEQEHQSEMEVLKDNNRYLIKELHLADLLLETYVPQEFNKKIKKYTTWNPDILEHQIGYIAHTGNNVKDEKPTEQHRTNIKVKTKPLYNNYRDVKHQKMNTKKFSLSCHAIGKLPQDLF